MTEYFDVYIRVSTQEQTKGFSLDTQEEVGRKIAQEKGLKIRLRNEGGRSSTIHYRPVLEELKIKSLFFTYTSIFQNKPDMLEIYRYFRINYFDTINSYSGNARDIKKADKHMDGFTNIFKNAVDTKEVKIKEKHKQNW